MPSLKQQLKQNIIANQRIICSEYNYTDESKELWRNLVSYFAGEDQRLNPDKGILLIGPIGCGKTTIFDILKEALAAYWLRFNSVCTWILADEYQSVGMKLIGKYLLNEDILSVYNRETPINPFIDDLGCEATV